jgi:hypothetical protein
VSAVVSLLSTDPVAFSDEALRQVRTLATMTGEGGDIIYYDTNQTGYGFNGSCPGTGSNPNTRTCARRLPKPHTTRQPS